MASQHYNQTLTDWHVDTPKLSMTVYMDTDGNGKMTYNGYIGGSGSFYNYHLYFFACNDGSGYDYTAYHNMAYLGEFAPNTNPQVNGGSMVAQSFNFNLSTVGLNKSKPTYIYYYCFTSYGSVSPGESGYPAPADSGFVCTIPALLTAPSISGLSLRNPKANSTTVSNNPNEISITASRTGGDDYTMWETWICGPDITPDEGSRGKHYTYTEGDYFNNHYDTFHYLHPRTEYIFDARMHNGAGDSGWAGEQTYRTLSDPPTVTVESTSKTLNSVTFKYKSNYSLNKIFYKYKIGNGNWSAEQSQSASGTTGSITLYTEPNTTVHIKIYGQEDWDNQKASEPTNESSSCTTYDKAYTKVQQNIIHNNGAISISTTNPSGNDLTFQILDGNEVIFSQSVTKDTTSISLSEAQWDNIYKRYGNNNSKSYTVKIITAADSGHDPSSYEATDARTITLTGIQKTTHVGASGPKRAMVWYSENGVMKHAVVWVGAGGGTKRTI